MFQPVDSLCYSVPSPRPSTLSALEWYGDHIGVRLHIRLQRQGCIRDSRKDIDANTAAIETKADKADFEELAKYTADMGKKVNDIGDEVTALSDATSAAITLHTTDISESTKTSRKATEALEANSKDIDENTEEIEAKADKADFEELAKYTADMGKK
ncbi:hypothetical protein ACTHSY_11900, partial [Neisseria sp. P0013.S004]